MAYEILNDMVNKAPTRGAQVTLGSAKEIGCMVRELNAEQGDMAHGTIMFREAITICCTVEPKAPLLYIHR